MRRGAPVVILGALLALLLALYIVYSQRVVVELRADAGRYGQMYARVFGALADPREESGNAALLVLSRHIRELGVPVIVTDMAGNPTAAANLPFESALDDPRVREYIPRLDRQNAPVVEPGIGTVHFGDSKLITSLRVIPVILASLLVMIFGAGLYILRERVRTDRERVWAGMARESAHQLATPLSSLSGWLELLGERTGDEVAASAINHMGADLERLERVSHRFERIGRPPRRDRLDLGDLVARVGEYFQARVPTLAHQVTIMASRGNEPVIVEGDEVLLEWALEVLVKNALDALAGRGGKMHITTRRLDPDRVRIRVADDGPGIPRELRNRIFEPGFTTKQARKGVGYSHTVLQCVDLGGRRLIQTHSEKGATFDIILQG
jgi:signal transduction histidine kinase